MTCKKRHYSRGQAQRQIMMRAAKSGHIALRAYECRHCKRWHLTRLYAVTPAAPGGAS